MRDFAIVTGIDGQKIEVVSLISDACVACNSIECARRGKSFCVINKKNLPLRENAVVRIGFPRVLNGILGLISLLVPILSALAGFLLSPLLSERVGFALNQTSKALTTGAFFLAATFVIMLVSRTDIHLTKPEVMQIL